MDYLIVLIIGTLAIYLSYKFFSWLLIENDPFLNPVKTDQPLHKPNFFTSENKKLAQKDLKDQNKFTLTEVSKMPQIVDKATQNCLINTNIVLFNNKETKS